MVIIGVTATVAVIVVLVILIIAMRGTTRAGWIRPTIWTALGLIAALWLIWPGFLWGEPVWAAALSAATPTAQPAAAPTAVSAPSPSPGIRTDAAGTAQPAPTADEPGQDATAQAALTPSPLTSGTAQPAPAASADPLCDEKNMEAALGGLDVQATDVACAFTWGSNNGPLWAVPIGAGVFATVDEGGGNKMWVGGFDVIRQISAGTFRAASLYGGDPCAWAREEQAYAAGHGLKPFVLGNFNCPTTP